MYTNKIDCLNRVPQSLAYPNLVERSFELFTGSIRLDAMRAIRTSQLSDWKLRNSGAQSLDLDADICRVSISFDKSGSIRSVSLLISDEFRVLRGDCEMAQRLLRFVGRQLAVLHSREKKQAEIELAKLVAGGTLSEESSIEYSGKRISEEDTDTVSRGWRRQATLNTRHGSIVLDEEYISYESRRVFEVMNLQSQMYGMRAYYESRLSGSCEFFPPMGAQWIPPSPPTPWHTASATFIHTELDQMRELLGASPSASLLMLSRKRIKTAIDSLQRISASS